MPPQEPENVCFGCGKDNPYGMQLQFYLDEENSRAICHFSLTERYTGPPGHAHGGIIATVLDEAMAKVNRFRQAVAMTRKMELEYLKPVPIGKPLTVVAHEKHFEGRKRIHVAELRDEEGNVLARGEGLFIAIDPGRITPR
jgi:uncharacterized protein (TIGR00369 family)